MGRKQKKWRLREGKYVLGTRINCFRCKKRVYVKRKKERKKERRK